MQARMNNPVFVIPEAMQALMSLNAAAHKAELPPGIVGLVQMRARQISGCSLCLDMHARDLKKAGETDQRLFAVGAWRDAPFFTDSERAALALTESVTRLSDRSDPVPDEEWREAANHFDETQLSALLISIAAINVWNRLNVATRPVAGSVPR